MIKTLLVSIFLLGFASIALTGNFTLKCLAASDNQPAESPFAGRWYGEWTETTVSGARFSDGETEHNGTWDISIASDGEVTGTEFDKTAGEKTTFKGFIDEDGYIKVFVKYSKTSTIKGVLEKKGTHLTGTLKQSCASDNSKVCATIDIILKLK